MLDHESTRTKDGERGRLGLFFRVLTSLLVAVGIAGMGYVIAKGGQADFHENHPGGMVVPQVDLRNLPRAFRIFETGQRLID